MKPMLDKLDHALSVISRWADYASGALLMVLTVDVFAEVFFRYALSMPIRFSSELAVVLFPWMVFLSAILITQNDGHIGIVVIREAVKGMRRKILEIFILLTMIAFSVTMLVAGWNMAMRIKENVLPIMQVTTLVLYITVPLSFTLITAILVVRLARVVIAPPQAMPQASDQVGSSGASTV